MPAFAGMTEFRTFYEFVIIRRSIFSLFQPGGVSYEVSHERRLWPRAPSLIEKETVPFWRSFIRASPLAKKTASLIKKET